MENVNNDLIKETLALKVENVSLSYEFMQSKGIKQTILNFYKLNEKKPKKIKYDALKNVSFEVKHGDVVGIIGKNGAGKSTLLKIVAGVFSPNNGKLETYGQKVSLLALGTGFQNELTGIENIYLNGLLLGLSKKEIDKRKRNIIDFADIGEFIYRPVSTYSSGMVARLAFSIAIYIDPDILLIDEIVGVGDKDFKEKSSLKVQEQINSGKTVLIVSHSLSYIKEQCNKVLWLEKGEVIMYGDKVEVLNAYANS